MSVLIRYIVCMGVSPLVTALLAGGFAILGAVVTQIGNFKLEKLKIGAADKTRFHSERREVYAKFLAQVDLAYGKTTSYAAYLGERDRWEVEDNDAWQSLTMLRTQVEMVGSPEVSEAAAVVAEWYDECVTISTTPGPVTDSNVGAAENAFGKLYDARVNFLKAVKRELGT